MNDSGASNGEVSAAAKVEERARLGNKPILEWTREDWQRWAAGLNEAQDEPVGEQPVVEQPARDKPVVDESVQDEPARDKPAQDEPAQDEPVVEPVPAEAGVSTMASVETEGSPSQTARQLSPGLSATRPWPGRPPEAPPRTTRSLARSALGLMMLAVAVGALVAGLVTFTIVVSSLVLRRVLGS